MNWNESDSLGMNFNPKHLPGIHAFRILFVMMYIYKGNGDGKSFRCEDGGASLYTKLLREREGGTVYG